MFSLLRIAFLLSVATATNSSSNNTNSSGGELYFSFITAKTGDFTTVGTLPLVDYALELVNENPSILPNYTLNYTSILDDGCLHTASLDAFFQHIQSAFQPTYLSTMCCGCSTATIPVADISHHWNIPQISYAASATILNDHGRFRGFFRTLQSQQYFPDALVKFISYFGWTQMVVITQDESLFRLVADSLVNFFDNMGWKLHFSLVQSDLNSRDFPYDDVFDWDEDYRVIFVNTYQPYVLNVFCEAYYRKLFGPKYVYITRGFSSNGWWTKSDNDSCPSRVIEQVLNKSIVLVPTGKIFTGKLPAGISGLTSDEVHDEYLRRLSWPKYAGLSESSLADYAFDAVWTLALALDSAVKKIASMNDTGCEHVVGKLLPLEDFDYMNEKMGCLMIQSFSEVSFTGASGEVYFESTGSRFDNVLEFNQYRMNDKGQFYRHPFALVTVHNTSSATFQYKENENNDTVWSNGVPYDGAVMTTFYSTALWVVVFFSTLTSIGVVYSAFCLAYTFLFRTKTIMKLASPNLNYVLITGAALQYCAVYFILFTADSANTQTILCNLHRWLYAIGYSTSFAVILAKTWRVYYIFNKPLPKSKVGLYKDRTLFAIVGIVVGVEILILLVGTAVPQSMLNATLIVEDDDLIFVNEDGINVQNYILACGNTPTIVWLAISYVYQALMQIMAMFMAFHTRKIKVKGLNDTKEIFALVYLNSIILVLLAITEFALQPYHTSRIALLSLAHITSATMFLSIVIIPRVINLYRDPDGSGTIPLSKDRVDDSLKSDHMDMVMSLKKRITQLEGMLDKSSQENAQ